MSQEQLGFEAGIDRVYVSLLERGERSPSLPVIVGLAKALGTSAAEMVALVESRVKRL
jgi:transcriptional regulator with XRE-family HTH domain